MKTRLRSQYPQPNQIYTTTMLQLNAAPKKPLSITRFAHFGCLHFEGDNKNVFSTDGLWAPLVLMRIILLLLTVFILIGCDKKPPTRNALHYQQAAKAYLQQGQIQAAVIEAQNSLQINPGNAIAHQILGEALLRSGAIKTAIDQFQQALRSNPNDSVTINLLAAAYLQMGRYDLAASLLSEESSDKEAQIERQCLRIELKLAQQQAAEADSQIQALLPNSTPSLTARLQVLDAQALLLMAADTGDRGPAQQALHKALVAEPNNVEALIWQGHLLLADLRYEEAEKSYAKALRQLQKIDIMVHPRLLAMQGMIKALVGQNKTTEALQFNKLIAQSPQGKLFTDYQTAVAKWQEGDVKQATQTLQQLVTSTPQLAQAQAALGSLRFAQGQFADAEQHLLTSLNQTQHHNTYLLTALAQWQQGKTADMIPLLQTALKTTQPADLDMLTLLGLAQLREKQLEASQRTLQQAQQLNPQHMGSQLALAEWESQTHDYAAAQKRYLRLLNQANLLTSRSDSSSADNNSLNQNTLSQSVPDKNNSDKSTLAKNNRDIRAVIYQHLASLQQQQGKSAVNFLQQLQPQDSSAYIAVLLKALLQEQRWQTAAELAEKNLPIFADDEFLRGAVVATYLALAQHHQTDNRRQALEYVDRCIQLAPQQAIAYAYKAHLLENPLPVENALAEKASVEKAAPQAVLAVLEELQKQTGQQALAQQLMGDFYTRQQQPALALIAYQTAAKQQPDSIALQLAIAQTEWQLNHLDNARKGYDNILAKQPDNIEALNNLAWLLIETDLPKAQQLANRAHQLAPQDPRILDTYAWILVQLNQLEAALPLFEQALHHQPPDAELIKHYHQALLRTGKTQQAEVLQQQYKLSVNPIDAKKL